MPEQPPAKRRQRTGPGPPPARTPRAYAELHCYTNYSFLRGASHPDELVVQAAALGYRALAITDRHSLAGVVRAHLAARELGFPILVGAEVTPVDAPGVVLLATDRAAYGRLARLLTLGKQRAPKGECRLTFDDVAAHADGLLACAVLANGEESVACYREAFKDRCYALAELHRGPDDRALLAKMKQAARQARVPLAAANAVCYHAPERRFLHDALTAIRARCTVADLGSLLLPNGERYLKPVDQLGELFADCPAALANTVEIAGRCRFALDELRYEYPHELCPPGQTSLEHLHRLTWAGAKEHYPHGIPPKVRCLIEHELTLIEELRYEAYFLTVWDLVRFARGRNILCQGRGSAANSAVCFCLGVTSVDPERIDVLFERFVSKERNEAPDI
ncbi:MAG: PHP domain-containing protein, partial [Gemmataceae bacterium]